jgi:hypothetical protein
MWTSVIRIHLEPHLKQLHSPTPFEAAVAPPGQPGIPLGVLSPGVTFSWLKDKSH